MLQKIKSKFGYPESEKNQTEKEKKKHLPRRMEGAWESQSGGKIHASALRCGTSVPG